MQFNYNIITKHTPEQHELKRNSQYKFMKYLEANHNHYTSCKICGT